MKIGIESCYGFGDCLMNAAVIKKLTEFVAPDQIDVAVGEGHQDAFYNIPNVNIIPLKGFRPLGKGMEYFKNNDYQIYFQMTQHVTWNMTTPLWTTPCLNARNFCIEYGDATWCDWETVGHFLEEFFFAGLIPATPKILPPIFIPTQEEIANAVLKVNLEKPMIAIETGFTSNQSWLDDSTVRMIYDHYKYSHEVLFVSKDNEFCSKLNGLTRRECVILLSYCEKFFNTCSGFFVASLSESIKSSHLQNICMITEEAFKQYHFQHLQDEPSVTLAFNEDDLIKFLKNDKV